LRGEWRQLHEFDLSSNIIRVIRARETKWAVHATRMGEKINAWRVLVRKPKRHRRKWEDNIKINLQ
jgi:hypothetical protein